LAALVFAKQGLFNIAGTGIETQRRASINDIKYTMMAMPACFYLRKHKTKNLSSQVNVPFTNTFVIAYLREKRNFQIKPKIG